MKNFDLNIVENAHNIDNAIVIVILLIYISGVVLLLYPALRRLWIENKRNSEKARKARGLDEKESTFRYKLEKALRASLGREVSAEKFIAVVVIIWVATVAITFTIVTTMACFVLATVLASVPCLGVRLLLERKRNKSSAEAENLVNEILIQYRANNLNIEGAIEATIKGSAEIPLTRPLLKTMLIKIRETRDKSETKKAINEFSYSIKTNWATILGYNIYVASIENIKIGASLEDLIEQLRDARVLEEEKKRLNAETSRIFWAIPVMYFILMYLSLSYCDLTLAQYIDNQFGTALGLVMFVAIVALTFISYMIIALKKNKRFDF